MRVIRLIIYDGPEDRAMETVEKSIQGIKDVGKGLKITGITLGTMPDELIYYFKEGVRA
jgi:hypothetical protein